MYRITSLCCDCLSLSCSCVCVPYGQFVNVYIIDISVSSSLCLCLYNLFTNNIYIVRLRLSSKFNHIIYHRFSLTLTIECVRPYPVVFYVVRLSCFSIPLLFGLLSFLYSVRKYTCPTIRKLITVYVL